MSTIRVSFLLLVSMKSGMDVIIYSSYSVVNSIWISVFKNGPSKMCGTQLLKNLKWYGLRNQTRPGCLPQILLGPFLNTLTHISLGELTYGGVYRTQSNIFEGTHCENSQGPLAVNRFRMQTSPYMFDRVLNTSLSNTASFEQCGKWQKTVPKKVLSCLVLKNRLSF